MCENTNCKENELNLESETIFFSDDEDDEFEFQNINKEFEEKNDHERWAFDILEYFMEKWKQKQVGNPPSNWKAILV